ncbi:hypothetical protein KTQ42_12595|uniref:hypothetical protein n=1 Tax=Noviherbaspirillum sp. L7-7A TaxID=2850560 RepID=UPI001C2CBE28|nr:hypothetical protein [Noviherbaspirillum sp. L7-7A]MBV0880141.1 hypothetical protein [Noviherbaspirillum sp. L7-7A]
MDSTPKLGISSANLHELNSPDAVTDSTSPTSNQTAPVLSERKTNSEPLLGQNQEKVAFKHYFGNLVLRMLTSSEASNGLAPQDYFRHASACIVLMQESDKPSATHTLLDLLKNRVDIYTHKASVMGSGLARDSRETARDMLSPLKYLAEREESGLDDTIRASLQRELSALEAQVNLEYELRNDKENGVHAVLLQPKSS